MSSVTSTHESPLVRLCSMGQTKLRSAQQHLERRRLESRLASLVEAARGHQAQNVPAGAEVYRLLEAALLSILSEHCERWEVQPDQLQAELPAIGMLRQLAKPQHKPPRSLTVVLYLIGSLAAAFALGLVAGLVRLGYHLLGGGR